MAILHMLFAAASHAHLRSFSAGPEHPVESQALETSLSRPHMMARITNPPPLAAWHPTIFFDGDASDAFAERQRRRSEGRDRQGVFRQMQRALDAYSTATDTQREAVHAFASWSEERRERRG